MKTKNEIAQQIKQIFENGATGYKVYKLVIEIINNNEVMTKVLAEKMYYKGYYDKESGKECRFEEVYNELKSI